MKTPTKPGEPLIGPDAIGAGLRRMFDDVVNEPVPDEFLELLRQADDRRGGGDPQPGRTK